VLNLVNTIKYLIKKHIIVMELMIQIGINKNVDYMNNVLNNYMNVKIIVKMDCLIKIKNVYITVVKIIHFT